MASAIQISSERSKILLRNYQDAISEKRRQSMLFLVVMILVIIISCIIAEVRPALFWKNAGNFTDYFGRLMFLDNGQSVLSDPAEWFWGLKKWSISLFETLLMAYVGTLLGAFGAFMLCFAASKNVTRSFWVVALTRRFLEFSRTVPEIVFALIFVVAFGLGPVAGVLAIVIHTMGALGKLFAEVVENIDMKFLPYEYNMQDLHRREALNENMPYLNMGYIFHFNAIPNNGDNSKTMYWMETTYNKLYGTNQ